MVEATKNVIGNILISRAFSPSISAGLGPLGAYKINKKELIIPQPKVPAPTTRKASLFPRFVAFSKKVVP